ASMPTCCSMISETAKAPMRDWARGPSGTLTASTPASFRLRTPSIIFDGSQPLGGTISTLVTNWLLAILAAKRERSAKGAGSILAPGAGPLTGARAPGRGLDARAAFTIGLMCSGVVPQQPPMNFTPALINRLAYLAMYSGEAR